MSIANGRSMRKIKYAVIDFRPDTDEAGWFLGTTDMGLHYENILEAEEFREKLLAVHKQIDPQNLQVISYAIDE